MADEQEKQDVADTEQLLPSNETPSDEKCRSCTPDSQGKSDPEDDISVEMIFSNPLEVANWITLSAVAVYFLLGCMISMLANPNWDFFKALYFTVVSLSTVGYGDYYPTVKWHKLVNSLYLIVGLCLVAVMVGVLLGNVYEFHKTIIEKYKGHLKLTTQTMAIAVYSAGFFIFFVLGLVFLTVNEPGIDFFQAFSTVTTTLTTVGYGDAGFTKGSTRFFLTFYIFFGVAYTAAAFSSVVTYLVKLERDSQFKRIAEVDDKVVAQAISKRMMDEGMFNDGAVSKSEFHVFCLKQLGRVSPDDIELLDTIYSSLSETDGEYFQKWTGGKNADVEAQAEAQPEAQDNQA